MAGTAHSEPYRRMIEKLRLARLDARLKQSDVATALGKPQSYVSKVENGERRIDPVELRLFARLYGKRLGDFVD